MPEPAPFRGLWRWVVAAVTAAVWVPTRFYLETGEVPTIAWGLSVFLATLCLLVGVGLYFARRTEIGETSVVISVSAPHRRAAFEACEWAIRELKRTVPIWKKEFFEDGEIWVEGEGVPEGFRGVGDTREG